MNLGLEGKVALVTGGSRGIGRATALALAAEGARVAIAARERGALDEAATLVEARHGIRVVGVNPAPVETRRLQAVFETEARVLGVSVEEARRRWLAHVPLGRAATPEEIADVIVFLASPRASFVTGTVVHADGGATRSL